MTPLGARSRTTAASASPSQVAPPTSHTKLETPAAATSSAWIGVPGAVGTLSRLHASAGVTSTASRTSVPRVAFIAHRSEEHTSELQSLTNLVCRLLLEKKKQNKYQN